MVRSSHKVSVQSRGLRSLPISCGSLAARAESMLAALRMPDAELSVLLCDDRQIHELNREFRGKDRPTDVLAFALQEGEAVHGQENMLGDVVISVPTARRQAQQKGHSIRYEITFLLAHGLLHLFGYDHQTAEEEREMQKKTELLVGPFR